MTTVHAFYACVGTKLGHVCVNVGGELTIAQMNDWEESQCLTVVDNEKQLLRGQIQISSQ